ncbi:MAG: TerB family tellurite resistance protein [Myxococcota bacterium]
MSLLRFFGIGGRAKTGEQEPASLAEITTQLDGLPAAEARFVAAFSYLLARIAGADLRTDDTEREAIAHRLESFAGIDVERAALLAATAIQAADSHHASDDHLVARTFRELSEKPERLRLLRCLYAVAAADENISAAEDNEIFEVAGAIGIGRRDVVALRSEFKEYLGSLKPLASER